MIKDKFNIELKVGDRVLFASGGQQDTSLYFGEVIELFGRTVKIKKEKGSTNRRRGVECINLSYIESSLPELFV